MVTRRHFPSYTTQRLGPLGRQHDTLSAGRFSYCRLFIYRRLIPKPTGATEGVTEAGDIATQVTVSTHPKPTPCDLTVLDPLGPRGRRTTVFATSHPSRHRSTSTHPLHLPLDFWPTYTCLGRVKYLLPLPSFFLAATTTEFRVPTTMLLRSLVPALLAIAGLAQAQIFSDLSHCGVCSRAAFLIVMGGHAA